MREAGLHRRPRRRLPLRLLVWAARALPLALVVVLVFAAGNDHVLDESVDAAASARAWIQSLVGLAVSVLWPVGFFAVILAGFAANHWVGYLLDDAPDTEREPSGEPSPDATQDEIEERRHGREAGRVVTPGLPWPLRAARGLGVVLVVWGLVQMVGLPWAVADQGRAQMLTEQGVLAEATDMRVEVERGEIHAIALQDVEAWNEFEVQVEPVLPVAGLLLVVAAAVPSTVSHLRSHMTRS